MTDPLFPEPFTLLHNPRCSKSRAAKALLEERGVTFRERRYLEEPLSRPELEALAQRLGQPASHWVRRSEAAYADAGLVDRSSPQEIIDAMLRFPILIERPILVTAEHAVVGRPPERVLELLG